MQMPTSASFSPKRKATKQQRQLLKGPYLSFSFPLGLSPTTLRLLEREGPSKLKWGLSPSNFHVRCEKLKLNIGLEPPSALRWFLQHNTWSEMVYEDGALVFISKEVAETIDDLLEELDDL